MIKVRSKVKKARKFVKAELTNRFTTHLAAKALVRDRDGRILVIRRSKTDPRRPLTWDLPGGSVKHGEDPILALAREVQEETGFAIGPVVKPVRVSSRFGKDEKARGRNRKVYAVHLIFDARVTGPALYQSSPVPSLSSEHDEHRWLSPATYLDNGGALGVDMPERYASVVRHVLLVEGAADSWRT